MRKVRWLLIPALAVMPLSTALAQTTTPTQDIAACIDNAAQVFADCVEEHAWYVAPLCAAAYASDVLLCGPMEIIT